MKTTETKLGEITGRIAFDALRINAFNKLGIDVHGVAVSGRDTSFVYAVYTEAKMNKAKTAEVSAWAAGFISACEARS